MQNLWPLACLVTRGKSLYPRYSLPRVGHFYGQTLNLAGYTLLSIVINYYVLTLDMTVYCVLLAMGLLALGGVLSFRFKVYLVRQLVLPYFYINYSIEEKRTEEERVVEVENLRELKQEMQEEERKQVVLMMQ